MKLFEENGIPVLLQYIQWKSEGMAMVVVMFPYICAISYLVFQSAPKMVSLIIFF
jgi:hypothetical protein